MSSTPIETLIAPRLLNAVARREMYELFARHYDEVTRTAFDRDLAAKDLVILLHAPGGTLVGFTTLSSHDVRVAAKRMRYIFSGDTVMDSKSWGRGHLLKSWFRTAGAIKARSASVPLYWFLIVKGHRTYRILENFFRDYVPRVNGRSDRTLLALRDTLAGRRFKSAFDPSSGLIDFGASHGQLAKRFHDAQASSNRPLVREFLKLNPEYTRGVELACLAELRADNLKGYAASQFAAGLRAGDR